MGQQTPTRQRSIGRQVDDLAFVLDLTLERIGVDTATPGGAAMAVAMLATGITNDPFWQHLAEQVEDRTRTAIGLTVPDPVRWALIGRYSGLRDAAIDAAADAWDALDASIDWDGGF